jgi:TolB-like protein
MSDDAGNEYFSDGISEELLNLFSKIPELRVISRSSAFAFKGEKIGIPEVAKKLNVAHILEGSVRKAGNQVRITAQLIDARSDTHLWSETYDRDLDDIFAIQDEIARKVAAALAAGLRPMMCVGETLDEREAGGTAEVLVRQTRSGLEGVDVPDGFIIAYEPVWAIGTGRAATAEIAEEAVGIIRREVASLADAGKADTVRVLYGGSVTPDNVGEFVSGDGIDGALVGGASLKVDAFAGIVRETARVKVGAARGSTGSP